MIDLSVVIVSFNTRGILATTLSAVLGDTATLATQVIVVDNASGDGSVDMVRERFPAVEIVANDRNAFYTAGNNQGLARGMGRCLLVLNPDAVPGSGTLPAMVAYLDAHPDVGAISPRLCFSDGRVQRNCSCLRPYRQFLLESTPAGLVLRGSLGRVRDRTRYGGWDRMTERDVDVLPGSCIMLRRDVYEHVGGFDERFRMYFGEDDWCLRIRAAGFRVRYAPLGEVVHSESESVKQVRRLARRIYFEDMVRYVEKHFGRRRAILLNVSARPWRWAHDLADAWRG